MKTPARILIIDDDAGTRETLGDVLRLKGHTVETAGRGQEGLETLAARRVDAAIVDIKLPDISGLDLLQAIKKTAPDAEVIFITGYASLPTAIQAINGDAFAYVVKPFEMDHLLATLEKALEKQALTRALRESEERYRLITENTNDAMFLLDLEGRLVFSNRRGEELTGYPAHEMVGKPIYPILTPEGAERAQARLEAIRAGREAPPFGETQIVKKDGSRIWVEASFASVVKEGQVVGRLGVVHDITERKRAEEEIQRQRETLYQSEKLAAMGSLLAGVAHELNNPLSVVMGRTSLLRTAVGEGPLAEQAEKIADAAERCARIVKNFLALARQRPPERQEVRLNRVVEEAVELLAYPLRVDNVEVELHLAPDLPVLWADPHQLHQVVVNLITNAHHAMRETASPRRLTFTTRVDSEQKRVSLQVADTGPGIPPEVQARIFEPFFTTKPPGQGTGLGLSLCQGIIESHGGIIRVESAPGRGATFRIELPITAPLPKIQEPASTDAPSISGKAILVVDDESEVAEVLADMLTGDGHLVETANDGLAALAKLGERTYDLILSDLRMPELDGPELYREVARRHPDLLHRFVFLTGDGLSLHIQEFLEQTERPSLSKPFVLDGVRRVVQQVLRTA